MLLVSRPQRLGRSYRHSSRRLVSDFPFPWCRVETPVLTLSTKVQLQGRLCLLFVLSLDLHLIERSSWYPCTLLALSWDKELTLAGQGTRSTRRRVVYSTKCNEKNEVLIQQETRGISNDRYRDLREPMPTRA